MKRAEDCGLEVWSHDGNILEGVFGASERGDADLLVCALAISRGVKAKVLELEVPGIVSRPGQVKAAWDATPSSPVWAIVEARVVDLLVGEPVEEES